MAKFGLEFLLLAAIVLASCSFSAGPSPEPPPSVETPTAIPSPHPTYVWPQPTVVTRLPSSIKVSTLEIDGQYLDLNIGGWHKPLFPLGEEPIVGCGAIEVSYSPTYEYLLAVVQCPEGLNRAFLIRNDNGSFRQITGEWDALQSDWYSWAPNGEAILYFRHSNSYADMRSELPSGLVLYHIRSGNKLFLTSIWDAPHLPDDWSFDGRWLAYTIHCRVLLASTDGYHVWEIDRIQDCSNSGRLEWSDNPSENTEQLRYISTVMAERRSYLITSALGVPPLQMAKPVSLNDLLAP